MNNPFEVAARTGGPAGTLADSLRNGSLLQHMQHARGDGRLSSSSGEPNLSNGSARGGLSPSASAMAAVTIRSNSGPPLSSALRTQFGSGCFLVPGALLASGGCDVMQSLQPGYVAPMAAE